MYSVHTNPQYLLLQLCSVMKCSFRNLKHPSKQETAMNKNRQHEHDIITSANLMYADFVSTLYNKSLEAIYIN